MPHSFWLTDLLNWLLGPAVVMAGGWLGVRFHDPAHPNPKHIAHRLLGALIHLVV
jgi:hypothetical protein